MLNLPLQAGLTDGDLEHRASATRSKMQSSFAEASVRKAEQRRVKALEELRIKAKAYNITAGNKLGTQLSMTDAELEAELAKMDQGTQVLTIQGLSPSSLSLSRTCTCSCATGATPALKRTAIFARSKTRLTRSLFNKISWR